MGCLDAQSGENASDRTCEDDGDRQSHRSAKQCWANLSGDDDIRNQSERRGDHHRPLAWLVGIGDCGPIHGVEATGAVDDRTAAVVTTHVMWRRGRGTGQGSSWSFLSRLGSRSTTLRRLLPRWRHSLQLASKRPRLGVVGVNLPGIDGGKEATKGLRLRQPSSGSEVEPRVHSGARGTSDRGTQTGQRQGHPLGQPHPRARDPVNGLITYWMRVIVSRYCGQRQ